MDLLQVSQLLIAVAVATSILLQARGTGLSSTFGGESTAYRSRRGIERTLFRLTVVLVAVFIIISLVGARTTSPAARGGNPSTLRNAQGPSAHPAHWCAEKQQRHVYEIVNLSGFGRHQLIRPPLSLLLSLRFLEVAL